MPFITEFGESRWACEETRGCIVTGQKPDWAFLFLSFWAHGSGQACIQGKGTGLNCEPGLSRNRCASTPFSFIEDLDGECSGAPRKSAVVAPICVEQGKASRLVAVARILSMQSIPQLRLQVRGDAMR